MDFDGHPIGKESDFPFKKKYLGLMGIGVAANGDVWIADGSDNQLLYYPGGRVKDGRIVKVEELKSPFDIVIDAQIRVWVSNSSRTWSCGFRDDPSKVDPGAGISVTPSRWTRRAMPGWRATCPWTSHHRRSPSASVMEQLRLLSEAMLKYPKPTGVINMISRRHPTLGAGLHRRRGDRYTVGLGHRRQ
jgi:hypothetical protein